MKCTSKSLGATTLTCNLYRVKELGPMNKKSGGKLRFLYDPLGGILVFFCEFVQLGQREDRAVFADVFAPHVAPTAFPDTALHTHLK